MIKNLILTLFILIGITFTSNGSELFKLDLNEVESRFEDVTKIEKYVKSTEITTLEELKKEKPGFFQTANLSFSLFNKSGYFSPNKEHPLGLPSFWWGFIGGFIGGVSSLLSYGTSCLAGPIAILLVYIATEDTEETKKATWGCVAGSLAGLGVSAAVVYLWLTSYWYY